MSADKYTVFRGLCAGATAGAICGYVIGYWVAFKRVRDITRTGLAGDPFDVGEIVRTGMGPLSPDAMTFATIGMILGALLGIAVASRYDRP